MNSDKPVNIVMCDIDHFKNINDTYGHDAGDTVLKNIAQILQDGTRSGSDCAFRMGGEEMVLILNCEAQRAYDIAERLRSEVENAVHSVTLDGQEKTISVTISMGVHQMSPETEMTAENARAVFDSEFKKSDELVYAAKESGRNRIVGDNTESYIELDNFISDELNFFDNAQSSENNPGKYSIFIMNNGIEKAYFRNDNTNVDAFIKQLADIGENYPNFKGCTEISELEFARLEQSEKNPPAFCAEIDFNAADITGAEKSKNIRIWDNDKIAVTSLEEALASIRENGAVDLDYQNFAVNDVSAELTSEYSDLAEQLNTVYDDFSYHNSIYNAEHIDFMNKHGELPAELNSSGDRNTVSEYINNQLENGSNLSDKQISFLTELKELISDVNKAEKNISDFLQECENINDWVKEAQNTLEERSAEINNRSENSR
ncbi:MAG: GGDEF domain-containing protein [Ruminococcus sp.]|nr:GGDEF domain-containing protein [Ruminococcus sp.]